MIEIYNKDCLVGLKELNRNCIGFELNPEYRNLAIKRITEHK